MLPLRARWAAFILAAFLLAMPATASADTPPAPDCFYYVAGCVGGHGAAQMDSQDVRTVELDSMVTLNAGANPLPAFGVPYPENCVPGPMNICLFSNVAWKFSPQVGSNPVEIVEGCTGETTTCKIRYKPRGIGNEGDFYQTGVAFNQIGTTVVQHRKGFALYARPKFRSVYVNTTNAVNFISGKPAYAVRAGTNPTYANCPTRTITPTSDTGFDCVKVTSTGGSGQNPKWKFALPANSSWTLIMDPVTRTESGPTSAPGLRWPTRGAAVGNSDITETINPLPQGTLKVELDTGGSQIQKGTSRVITSTATVVGGQAPYDNVNWQVDFFGSTALSGSYPKLIDPITDPGTKHLLPGETSVATKTLKATDAPGSATITSKVYYSSRASGGQSVAATPVKVDAITGPVPPPPPPGGGSSEVPKPPIPDSATTSAITGRVADAPLTGYQVTWYAALSCDASDPTARLVASPFVTTDGAGNGNASAPYLIPVSGGESLFGYSTLNGKRSNRSDCVTVAGATVIDPPGPLKVVGSDTPPKKLALTLTAPKTIKAGKTFSLKVKVAGEGTVVAKLKKKQLAKAKVKKGAATLKLKLKKGKQKLTLTFTPTGGGPSTTQALTLKVKP
ncbi:MAG: hypothetical protein JHC95_11815 [Solirubrobacteraceae bacterium]|nr:hypothetical protein [Solirubrobacteraceae bacterium]